MTRLSRFARGFGWRAGLVLGAVAVAFALGEVVARLAAPPEVETFFTPFEHDDRSYRVDKQDPTLLYTLQWYVPGATGVTGTAPVRINNLGLRDERDYPEKKPDGCYRILVLGDSMTFGKGVAAEDTWPAVLERRLGAQFGGKCIEVLNAGQPNTNTFIQWIHYRLKWHQWQPDLVLVGFFVYNDTQLQGEEEPYSQRWMEWVDRHPGIKRSALVRWLYYTAFFELGGHAMQRDLPRFYDPEYEGWSQFRDAVRDLEKMATEHGARVAFALIPIPEGYDDYPWFSYHEDATRFLALEQQLPVFDLLAGLRGVDARKHWIHPSDAHPDKAVHERMALYLTEIVPWSEWILGDTAP